MSDDINRRFVPMLKRLDRLERLDKAIAETEIAITEQVLRILRADAEGRDAKTARAVLKTLYGILIEYRRAREAIVEAQELTGRRAGKAQEG